MTTTTTVTLTAEQLKALRNADSVSFHFNGAHSPVAFVRATKRVKGNDGFGGRDLTVEIPAEQKFTIYERGDTSGRRTPVDAFTSIPSCQFSPLWVTAAKFLKVDDRLVLHWTGGDTHQALRDAGFTVGYFDLEVARLVGKSGREERLAFRLDTSVSKVGSGWPLKF